MTDPNFASGTVWMVASLATLLIAASGPSNAHMSDECFAHVTRMEELTEKHMALLDRTSGMLGTYEDESRKVLASQSLGQMAVGFSNFMHKQLPTMVKRFTDLQDSSSRIVEAAVAAIGCTINEPPPVSTVTPTAPLDLDWLDEVMAGLDEPSELQQRVVLGVDCSKPLTISLPDDVLTECETE